MIESKDRRLTHSLSEGSYRQLRVKAAQEGTSIRECLESSIASYAATAGPFLVSATCAACGRAISVSTSGRTYLGGPGSNTAALSDESLALAESIELLRARNPLAVTAIEDLIRTL